MILLKTAASLSEYLAKNAVETRKIGFVPTMGALHNGHLELIRACKKRGAFTICSIFVNPTQFNDPKDFEQYPATIDQDLLLLANSGCDLVFLPSVAEIYPNGTALTRRFDLGYLETILEGKYRPGHFQGVCQVVHRLLEIVRPDILFLGRKDYQQCMVISKLVALSGWNMEMEIVPTLREPSGLALSSRNLRLTPENKTAATAIYRSLQYLKQSLQPGALEPYIQQAGKMLVQAGFEKIDYVAIADSGTLMQISDWDGHTQLTGLVAAFIGGIRLIDNMPLTGVEEDQRNL
jgi:pantoate--beta-alanine ligase